ncbi:zinc finger MYM-type protein 1-like [Dendrobates tinctorius]|uniref:zinc finger MYM-type protein 1-like n=1 Tax=Dendrobates tinctorius TaxID=92724 RepID=UPI003CC9267F
MLRYLAERHLALRGTTDKLYHPNNGNFLGQVEFLAKYDATMNEHVRRIQNKRIKAHYLSKDIQNELIKQMGKTILDVVAHRIHSAKYYGVIMDCTPDTSHVEQLSVTIRIVQCELSVGASVSEYFTGFLAVEETSGEALCNVFLEHLQGLKISIDKCRGQSYDNGSNMKGKKQGLQSRILALNKRALYMPCSSHTLNLVIVDAAKSSVLSVTFFGVLQQIYVHFSSSTQRWANLKKNVTNLTLKPLSDTRWECRIDSVKVLRYSLGEVCSALEDLVVYAASKKDDVKAAEAKSLANEISSGQFIICIVAWYDVLYHINRASKIFQKTKVGMDTLKKEIEFVLNFLQDYREHGFESCYSTAKSIAEEADVEFSLPIKRKKKKEECLIMNVQMSKTALQRKW